VQDDNNLFQTCQQLGTTRNTDVRCCMFSCCFSSIEDKTGNATFHVGIFEESQDETLRLVSFSITR
jgi:hypothetical protein